MTPKEKAITLFNKFYYSITGVSIAENRLNARRCAIECVDEILDDKEDALDVLVDDEDLNLTRTSMEYWQQVKHEINQL